MTTLIMETTWWIMTYVVDAPLLLLQASLLDPQSTTKMFAGARALESSTGKILMALFCLVHICIFASFVSKRSVGIGIISQAAT